MGVARILVGEGGRCGAMILVLPPRCPRAARAPLRGSGASIGGVSVGYPRGVVGGSEGAQPLGLGPQLSPDSCQRWLPFAVIGV